MAERPFKLFTDLKENRIKLNFYCQKYPAGVSKWLTCRSRVIDTILRSNSSSKERDRGERRRLSGCLLS